MADTDWIEPSCIARMARNGHTAKAIADLLGTNMIVVAGALRDADTAEKGVDRSRIVRSRIR